MEGPLRFNKVSTFEGPNCRRAELAVTLFTTWVNSIDQFELGAEGMKQLRYWLPVKDWGKDTSSPSPAWTILATELRGSSNVQGCKVTAGDRANTLDH